MPEVFLSEPWIEALGRRGGDLPKVDGVNVAIQHEIAGAPDGKVRFFLVWEEGRLTTAELGKHPDPDVVVQAKAPDAIRVLHGDLSPDVAYMQGRLKVDGAYRELLIDLRAWRSSEPYQGLWSAMAADTA